MEVIPPAEHLVTKIQLGFPLILTRFGDMERALLAVLILVWVLVLVWPDFDRVIAKAQVSEARRKVFATTRVG